MNGHPIKLRASIVSEIHAVEDGAVESRSGAGGIYSIPVCET